MDNRPPAYIEEGRPVYRISGLGGCPKSIVHWLNPEAKPDRRNPGATKAAKSGNEFEHEVIAFLEDHGANFTPGPGEPQELVNIKCISATLRGHTDGRIKLPNPDKSKLVETWSKYRSNLRDVSATAIALHGLVIQDCRPELLFEAKEMNDERYESWLNHGFRDFPGYALQVALYLRATKLPGVLYAVGRRKRKDMTPWKNLCLSYMPADHPSLPKWGKVVKLVSALEKARKSSTLPPCTGDMFCRFSEMCEVKPNGTPIIKPVRRTMNELSDLIAEERELNLAKKAAAEAHKLIADKIKKKIMVGVEVSVGQSLNVVAGDWKVSRYYTSRFDKKAAEKDGHGEIVNNPKYHTQSPQVRISGGPKND